MAWPFFLFYFSCLCRGNRRPEKGGKEGPMLARQGQDGRPRMLSEYYRRRRHRRPLQARRFEWVFLVPPVWSRVSPGRDGVACRD
ncbi:hypothetical protein GGR56DRAFT_504037 [Xylariaceae sp. FL0804]|nr:hypothetical protein GGR56DRAFT_504037 [Xylariaceae sp. FL0804]